MKHRKKVTVSSVIVTAILLVVAFIQLFPLYWMFTFSLKSNAEIFGGNIVGLPQNWEWENYVEIFSRANMGRYMLNSVIVTALTIFFTALLSTMATYAIVRLKWKLSRVVYLVFLVGMMLSIHAVLLPLFVNLKPVLDTYAALVLPYVAFNMPTAILLMVGSLEGLPKEMEEAAFIDGASIYRIFFRAVPREENIAVPGRRTAAVFFLLCILSLSLAAWIARLPVLTVFLVVHLIVLWILLYRLILCFDASRSQGSIPPQKKPSDFYEGVLTSIRREEALRQDFSNYLHDEILQDLLSMKNLIRKASQPDVGRLLEETLQKLTASIRSQMQFYHPAFSNALTFRENLQAALDSIQRESGTVLSLDCADTVFLIEPYAMPVCRIAKELVQNALKHAHASQVIVKLQQENDEVFLQVKDDGIGLFASTDDLRAHRGLASVREQVGLLQGSISIRAVPKKGTNISITIPMKGEESYAHFIGR